MAYRIEIESAARDHLNFLKAWQRALVVSTISEQLLHQPTEKTRNRKSLKANPIANWELRIGDIRVYYDVEDVPEAIVYIKGVGVKERNLVRLGNEVIKL